MAKAKRKQSTAHLVEQLSDLSLPLMWAMRQDAIRAFESLGIRPVKALLIELIARGLQHPTELSDVLDTVPPTISAMLAELEDRGYVSRHLDSEDRRRIKLSLTPEGQTLRARLRENWLETGYERLSKLSNDELHSLLNIYQKILEAA